MGRRISEKEVFWWWWEEVLFNKQGVENIGKCSYDMLKWIKVLKCGK